MFYSSGEDQEALFEQLLKGQLDFPAPYWDNVSDSAKVCVLKCSPHLLLLLSMWNTRISQWCVAVMSHVNHVYPL